MTTRVVNIYHKVPYDVYVGRAGKGQDGYFGNPSRVDTTCPECKERHTKPGETLSCFKRYFERRLQDDPVFAYKVSQLRGKTLACFCRPKDGFKGQLRCHAQIIAAYLDGTKPEEVE